MAVVEIDWNPTPKMLRVFGRIGVVVFLLLAAIVLFAGKFMFWSVAPGAVRPVTVSLAGLSVFCGLFAAAAPRVLWPLYIFMTVVFYPVGFVLGYVMMGVVYFLVITPIAVIFKIIGRDAMTREFDPSAETYWIKRRPPASVKRYLRQF